GFDRQVVVLAFGGNAFLRFGKLHAVAHELHFEMQAPKLAVFAWLIIERDGRGCSALAGYGSENQAGGRRRRGLRRFALLRARKIKTQWREQQDRADGSPKYDPWKKMSPQVHDLLP